MSPKHKIGVFDSGVGGKSVANAIAKGLPELDIIFRNDEQHLPYGTKSPEEVLGYVEPILKGMIEDGCELIVVACNTVSTTLIKELRERISVPLIALEPMVKPAAAHTKSGVIAVCATPTTLGSKRYAWLKDEFAKDVQVIEPDCSRWTSWIEAKEMNKEKIDATIRPALDAGADVIVLGCTHYHWIENEIKELAAGKAEIIQPEQVIVARVKKLLAEL